MKAKKFKAGAEVELADKDVGFYDPETEFKIVRDQKRKLGKSVGRKTNLALLSGGLLVVGAAKAADPDDDSDLPVDFPAREILVAEGLGFDQVKMMTLEELDRIKGVGPKTFEAIKKFIAEK